MWQLQVVSIIVFNFKSILYFSLFLVQYYIHGMIHMVLWCKINNKALYALFLPLIRTALKKKKTSSNISLSHSDWSALFVCLEFVTMNPPLLAICFCVTHAQVLLSEPRQLQLRKLSNSSGQIQTSRDTMMKSLFFLLLVAVANAKRFQRCEWAHKLKDSGMDGYYGVSLSDCLVLELNDFIPTKMMCLGLGEFLVSLYIKLTCISLCWK